MEPRSICSATSRADLIAAQHHRSRPKVYCTLWTRSMPCNLPTSQSPTRAASACSYVSTVPHGHGARVLSHGCQTNQISMSPRLDPASGVARAMVILLPQTILLFYHVTDPNTHMPHVTHVRTGSSANLFQGASVRARQSVPPRTVSVTG